MPLCHPWAIWKIQDGRQDGRHTAKIMKFLPLEVFKTCGATSQRLTTAKLYFITGIMRNFDLFLLNGGHFGSHLGFFKLPKGYKVASIRSVT